MSICALGLMTTPRHLNESPSNKEWKSQIETSDMPPLSQSLNESPSQKEGKSETHPRGGCRHAPLNESPSQKEGKYFCFHRHAHSVAASMKAPPKRKGNLRWLVRACSATLPLNESPSEKEGKSPHHFGRKPAIKSPQ